MGASALEATLYAVECSAVNCQLRRICTVFGVTTREMRLVTDETGATDCELTAEPLSECPVDDQIAFSGRSRLLRSLHCEKLSKTPRERGWMGTRFILRGTASWCPETG